jgi:hypothetical protein
MGVYGRRMGNHLPEGECWVRIAAEFLILVRNVIGRNRSEGMVFCIVVVFCFVTYILPERR